MRTRSLLAATTLVLGGVLLPVSSAHAAAPFTATPAGGGLNGAAFGNVALGQAKQLLVTVKNSATENQSYGLDVPTGTAFHRYVPSPDVSTDCVQGSGAGTTYLVVAPKGSCTLHVEFTPTALGAASTVLTVTGYASAGDAGARSKVLGASSGAVTVKASGTGVAAKVAASPTSIAFSKVLLTERVQKSTVVKNTSLGAVALAPVYPTDAGYLPPQANSDTSSCYKLVGSAYVSRVVGPAESCTLYVDFAPRSVASLPGTLTAPAYASKAAPGAYVKPSGLQVATVTVKLTGTGVGPTYTATPKTLAYGSVTISASKELSTVVKNTSTLPLYLRPVFADSAYDLPLLTTGNTSDCVVRTATRRTGLRLDPGSSCTLRVVFAPKVGSATKSTVALDAYRAPTNGAPYVDKAAAQDLGLKVNSVAIATTGTGVGPKITANPAKLAFGKVTLTSSNELMTTIANASDVPLFFRPSLPAGKTYELEPLRTGSDCLVRNGSKIEGIRVDPGESCFLWVIFSPGTVGAYADNLTVDAYLAPGTTERDTGQNLGSPVNRLLVPMTGTGVAPDFTLAPTSLSFGTVALGTSKSIVETITNKSDVQLQFALSSDAGTSYKLLPGSNGCANAAGQGLAVDAKGTCTVEVRYTPTAAGKTTGTLTVTARESVRALGTYGPYTSRVLNTKTLAISGTGK